MSDRHYIKAVGMMLLGIWASIFSIGLLMMFDESLIAKILLGLSAVPINIGLRTLNK